MEKRREETLRAPAHWFPVFLIVATIACTGPSDKGIRSNAFVLTGGDIGRVDAAGGVVQMSPGVEQGFWPQFTDSFSVPSTASLLRVKLRDDPVPQSAAHGLLQFVVEYSDIEDFLLRGSDQPPVDEIRFYLDRIDAYQVPPKGHRYHREKITLTPSSGEAQITIRRGARFAAVLRGASLPVGTYRHFDLHIKRKGNLLSGETEHPVAVVSFVVPSPQAVTIAAGKISTIHARPLLEHKRAFTGRRGICHPDHKHKKDPREYTGTFALRIRGVTTHPVPERIFIRTTGLFAEGAAPIPLNTTPSEFELLSLRDGFVGLLGHNMVPPGTYSAFRVDIGQSGRIETDGQSFPLLIASDSTTSFLINGPFDLRGGRITEVFLHFDPNRSVFFTLNGGYVLEPDITVTSVASMTSAQHQRVFQLLGEKGNDLVQAAEIIAQANVLSVTAVPGMNSRSQRMIYSNVQATVTDRLRGEVPTGSPIDLQVPGGTLNGLTLHAVGMPKFRANESVLLFLKRYGNRLAIVHGENGKIGL